MVNKMDSKIGIVVCFTFMLFIFQSIQLEVTESCEKSDDHSTYALPGEFPYQVSLQSNGMHFCSGSIVDYFWILTTAHCLVNRNESLIEIVAGSTNTNDGIKRKISFTFPGDYSAPFVRDIGLIKLSASLPTNNPMIKLVVTSPTTPKLNSSAILTGWRSKKSVVDYGQCLEKFDAFVISNNECQKSLPEVSYETMCALTNTKSFCEGDDGSPLVDANSKINGTPVQIGIMSSNYLCSRGTPDVYTELSLHTKDLYNIIEKDRLNITLYEE